MAVNYLKEKIKSVILNRNPVVCRIGRLFELFIGGGVFREKILLTLLSWHYSSRFRRQWIWSCDEEMHFEDHRIEMFNFAFGRHFGPYVFYRAFFSSELIREGDSILDIGCGDGFFTKAFFSIKCDSIDAIDIEENAILMAKKYNSSEKITYYRMDAVNGNFPRKKYDIIIWDGAIGHFERSTTDCMLKKISESLYSDGVFSGSESLGREEGHDHLQFFDSLDDLYTLFKPYFRYIHLRDVTYSIGSIVRREGYWRCSNNKERLYKSEWQEFEAEVNANEY